MDLEPDFPDAHYSLGLVLAQTGKLDEGIAHLQKAAAASPDDFEYRHNLGRALAAAGRFGEAIPHFEQAVWASGGRGLQSLDMLASMYAEVGRFREAAQAARRALDLATQQGDQNLVSQLKARIAAYEASIPAP